MSHFDESIAALTERLREQESRVVEIKKAINAICMAAERAPLFPDADLSDRRGSESVQPDMFYGQPLNSSAKRVLEMRKVSGLGAATIREIYEVLVNGGFDFKTRSEKNAMDGLRISLSKSSHTFHKLPNGRYGLNEWYPAAKTAAATRRRKNGIEEVQDDEEVGGNEESDP